MNTSNLTRRVDRRSWLQWLGFGRLKSKDREPREKRAKAVPATWRYGDVEVQAHTKGEARAKLKRLLGPIPHGAKVERLP